MKVGQIISWRRGFVEKEREEVVIVGCFGAKRGLGGDGYLGFLRLQDCTFREISTANFSYAVNTLNDATISSNMP